MHHHRHVDIVEMALVDELIFPAEVMELSFLQEAPPILNLHVLFRRYREKYHIAAKFRQNPCFHKSRRRRQHGRHLQKMTAGMGCTRQRIGFWTVRCPHCVQLAQYRHRRPWTSALGPRLHACQGQPCLRGKPQCGQITLHFCRRLMLLKA